MKFNLSSNFLQRELYGAQARIAVLDSEAEEKDKRISLLRAKIRDLEEKITNETYERYFPDSQKQSSSAHSKCSCQNHMSQRQCQLSHYCSHIQHSCQSDSCHHHKNSSTIREVPDRDYLRDCLVDIKEELIQIKDLLKLSHTKPPPANPPNTSDGNGVMPNLTDSVDPQNEETDLDESFASIETLIPDLPLQLPLN